MFILINLTSISSIRLVVGGYYMRKTNTKSAWKFTKYFIIVFNFIASLSSIIGLIYTLFYEKIDNNFSWIWIVSLIIVICGAISCILLLRSEKYDSWKECSRYAYGLHTILHCLRDMNKSLDELYKRNTKMEQSDFLRIITSDCIDIMNKLSNILSDAIQCKVRACIKLNDFIKENETNPQQMNLITFARSGKDGVNAALMEQTKSIKVVDNTDFEFIFNIEEVNEENREHYFYKKNLKRYEQRLSKVSNGKKQYKNSDIHWRKRYNTTIVMPIRYLKLSNKNEAVYDIVGFLCVDAKKAGVFEKKNFNFTIEFLKGISDILYSYLNSCVSYYKNN